MKTDLKYIFPFVKYIKPSWYFNLESKALNYPLWVDYNKADDGLKQLIGFDNGYSCMDASLRDAAYQFLNRGVMQDDASLSLRFSTQPTVEDNYRFVRRYFNPQWALVILFFRLLSLHNPFREIKAFYKNRKVKRINVYASHKKYDDIRNCDEGLLKERPLVSVIIPTLNRYKYLADVIKDLEKQTYKNFELIVCDQTDVIDEDFYRNRKIKIKLIKQREKALWLARNRSIKESKGEYVLLFDDDSRVEPDWVENHIRCIEYYGCDISSGVSLSTQGAKIPENYSFYCWSDQIDTGNVMLHKDVFKKVGLFDRQFEKQRMGDGEFGLRCYLAGLKNISNPDAKRIHLKVSTGGLRQMGSWDAFRPTNLLAPRPVPSVLYLTRKYFGNPTARLMLLISVPSSFIPYRFKSNRLLSVLTYPLMMILFPVIIIPIIRSWRISSRMLSEGDKIEQLDDSY